MSALSDFVRESNRIEGILRDPTEAEIETTRDFMGLARPLRPSEVLRLQSVYAPDKPLRNEVGMDVRVGTYIAPRGGPEILERFYSIIERISKFSDDPWQEHCAFETLHPFMDGNGRTGRALWAWHMQSLGSDPFALPFLHRWYYQTLSHIGR